MYLRSDESGPPMRANRPALRIAIFGGVALALFVILFFRLWFLQVINGSKYLAEANSNRTREFRVGAPRGEILDRNGKVLVGNRSSLALVVNPQKLPEEPRQRHLEMALLAELTHSPLRHLQQTIHEQEELAPGAPITLRRDVGRYLVYYVEENKDRFPGVDVQTVFVRRYPNGSLAAHVLGYVGEITKKQLKEPRYRQLEPGDEIGQEGVEATYDPYLRGKPGVTRTQVDASGEPTPGGRLVSERPVPGNNLKLTIDDEVQAAGQAALEGKGLPGGFVTMDIHTGEILGLGSFPTFDPTTFTRPLTQKQVNETYRNPLAPLADRTISGLYPTGSTFKIITALAALEHGVVTPDEVINDPGELVVGGETFKNAGEAAFGSVSLVRALEVSSDVYFYTLGLRMWNKGYLQQWAHELGIGRSTGIDLPGAAKGLLPTKQWRDKLAAEGEAEGRPWSAGDNIQLATGQGDLQTNPLQLAIAYAALGNGGTIVTPHVGKEIDDAAGRVLKEFEPPPRRHVHIDPAYRSAILEGLHDAAQNPSGTSYKVFGGFPVPVAGKTGTAQRPPHADQSWYAVLAPYPNPKIVTVVTIEEGGFGVESAAPAAHEILEAYFHEHPYGEGGRSGG
ncbi:MAG: penicillin-binding protein 2 [Solirubrobacterales bacterium]